VLPVSGWFVFSFTYTLNPQHHQTSTESFRPKGEGEGTVPKCNIRIIRQGQPNRAPASWSAPVLWRFPLARTDAKAPETGALQNLAELQPALQEVHVSDPATYSVTTSDLNLWYAKFQALINVSLEIKHGIITSLIGPSGCGKTTLLRCFNRVNERYDYVRTMGEIKLLGKNIYDPDVSLIELRKSVGMVFQRPNPMPISVYENVVFGLRIHSARRALTKSEMDTEVEKALTEVGLWNDLKDRLGMKATQLQLEQQQKLCIARLLPLNPKLS